MQISRARRITAILLSLSGLALLALATTERTKKSARAREAQEEGEAAADSPNEAARFRRLQLQDENGNIPIDGLQKAREQVALMKDAQEQKAKALGKVNGMDVAGIDPGAWAWLGPGNIGGRIRSIVIDPTNPNNMWVGSVSGGIWRSSNAGSSWEPVNDFLPNLAVSTIVMDPTNSSVMYAATGESFAADLSVTEGEGITPEGLRGGGIFKSTDGGLTWNLLLATDPAKSVNCPTAGPSCAWSYVNRLAISSDGNTLLAATLNGIQRSTNGGVNWNAVASFAGDIQDIDFDPTDTNKAIAARPGAARYSTNGGQTWLTSTFTPALNPIMSPGPSGRIEVAYAPSNPLIVYASVDQSNGVAPNQTQGEIFQSTDGGQNYTRLNTSNPGNTFLGGQGGYGNIIWVNPIDPNFVIVGGINLYRSTDGGTNWTPIGNGNNGSPHSDHHMIVVSPSFDNNTNKTVYFSNDGGIYRADDISTVTLTSGWTKLNNNLGITQFYGAAANSAGVIVGGTQDNGIVRFSGDPQAWTTTFGGDGGYAAADPTDPNYFYGEYTNLGLRRSSDGGASSGYIYCNPAPTSGNGGPCNGSGILDAFNGANFVAPFILDPNNPSTLLAGGLSLWRSNDVKVAAPALPIWTAIKQPVSNGLIPPKNVPISAIVVSPNNSDFIVVGHNDGRIYLTFDGTGTNPPTSPAWSQISNATTPTRFVTRLAIDETRSPNWIYATFGGFSNNNVYVTKDLGGTWIDVSGIKGLATDLPAVPVRSLVINPVRADLLYVGTEVGVFASEDAGATWSVTQDGPANVPVDELFWLNGELVAVTHGRGLYTTYHGIYNFPACTVPPGGCPCFGNWDCACNWNNKQVPTANDDVLIYCPVTAPAGGQARNIRVENRLTLGGGLGVTGDVFNAGYIVYSPGGQSSIGCRNLINIKPPHVSTYQGTIELLGGISASGDVTNSGVIALGTSLDSNNLTTAPGSTLTLNVAHINGNLFNYGLIEALGAQSSINVSGNIDNGGTLKGAFLFPRAPASLVKNFSGSGLWQFSASGISQGYTVKLASDITLDIASFNNNGTLDFGDKMLNFKGNSFQGGGIAAGTGLLKFVPTGGTSVFNANGPAVTIASGTVEYQSGGTVSGPFTIATGATFVMNTGGTLTLNNDALVNGALTKTGGGIIVFDGQTFTNNGSVGDIDFITFNDTGSPKLQSIAGTGPWSPTNIQIGQASPSTTTVTLQNDVTFTSNQLATANGSALNVGSHTLTLRGQSNFFFGKIGGTGLVKMQPNGGTPRLGTNFFPLTIDPSLEIVSGVVKGTYTTVGGTLTIDAGAALSLFGFADMTVKGDFLNNGTLNAFSDNPSLNFKGATFTNNGNVTGSIYVNLGLNSSIPLAQNLAGTGSWAGSPRLFVDALSTTTLLSDVTYDGANLYVEGRLNTGPFTLSLPCAVSWSGAGDVVGNIRRTNLTACPGGAIAYGSPFTTITFNSGTPPTEISVKLDLSAPSGFASAVQRTYTITPTGGSGYAATLRLHYLDSELNGNNEAGLQLLRQDGMGWNAQGASNRNTTDNWVEYANVTQFSPWTLSSLTPPPLPNTFANWQHGYFTAQELANPAISGDAADPDSDGLSNLLEYAFHSDPKQSASANRPYDTKDPSYFSLIYTRALAPSDLTYTIEESPDLFTWFAVTATNVILADDGITQTVKAQVPIMGARRMSLRLRITH